MKEKFQVSKTTLFTAAGLCWAIPGIKVFFTGVNHWVEIASNPYLKIFLSLTIFSIFFFGIFRVIFKKYTNRIHQMKAYNPPLSFFSKKGWGILIFMMCLGVASKNFPIFPPYFIAVFYPGIAMALVITGTLFIREGFLVKNKIN